MKNDRRLWRRAETKRFGPADFDQASAGLFLLLAQKAARGDGPQTHFMPLAMYTHRPNMEAHVTMRTL